MNYMNWSEKAYDCGCEILTDNMGTYEISYCPKHTAAPEMYEALKGVCAAQEVEGERVVTRTVPSSAHVLRMKKALAKAKGGK